MSTKTKATIGLDYSHNNILTLEASSYAEFTQYLFSSGYKLGKIQAGFDSLKKLETYQAIILSTPRNSNINPAEIEVLDNYVKNGGNLFIVSTSGADYSNKTNLNELTHKFGFEFVQDEVHDSMNFVNVQKRPLLVKFTPHFITEQLKQIVISSACSLKALEFLEDEKNIKIQTLISGGLNCWRKIYNGKDWVQEDSPKIPLLVVVEYYRGKVIGFGNLSIFSSLGSEYGFSAFDNALLIANSLRWLTMGAATKGKVVSVNINIDLFYWLDKVLKEQNWENISDIVNVGLKYFKDHYKKIMESIVKLQEDKEKRKEEYQKAKKEAEEESAEDKILALIPARKREDLEGIMNALEEITGEKYELSVDLGEKEKVKPKIEEPKGAAKEEEVKQEQKEITELKEETTEPSEKAEPKKEPQSEPSEKEKTVSSEDLERRIENSLKAGSIEMEKSLNKAMKKEQKEILGIARQEIEKEMDRKIEDKKVKEIEKELGKQIGDKFEKEKQNIIIKAKEEIEKESRKIIENVKLEIEKKEIDKLDKNSNGLLERAKEEFEKKELLILQNAKEQMEKERVERIKTVKERELSIIKENQKFFEELKDATDKLSEPILKPEDKENKKED